VDWEAGSHTLWSSFAAVLAGPAAPRGEIASPYFRESWVRWRIQKRALVCSLAWHIVIFTFPFPAWRDVNPRPAPQFRNVQIVWYSPPRDLPPLRPRGPAKKPSPPGEPRKPLPRRGADAYHPRQLIISAPVRVNHPRQTLIQPEAPPEPPKILPPLPNIVQWAEAKQPLRPKLNISQQQLAKLRPKAPARRPEDIPLPAAPNLEPQIGDLNIAASTALNRKPALPMVPTSAPRGAPQPTTQNATAAPDIVPELGNGNGELQRLIALSATPAPPAPIVEVPPGNLAANVTISPEGTQPGTPGGSPTAALGGNGGAGGASGSPGGTGGAGGTQPGTGAGGGAVGAGPPGISITGGNPGATSNMAGSGSGIGVAPGTPLRANPLPPKPEPRLRLAEPDRTRPSPGFEPIQPGAPPEAILGAKRVYTLKEDLPNLSSATGSWVFRYAELDLDSSRSLAGSDGAGELSRPEPLRKVDPKYPPALISARVQGEVILYAVIRKDGTVDSIQVVKGVDPQLDQNAMAALAKWKFRPAARNGEPVELEAVVHIPFRIGPRL
jgi:protein TonB